MVGLRTPVLNYLTEAKSVLVGVWSCNRGYDSVTRVARKGLLFWSVAKTTPQTTDWSIDFKGSPPNFEQLPMRGGQHPQCQLRPQATQSSQLSTAAGNTKIPRQLANARNRLFANANDAWQQGHVARLLCHAPQFPFPSHCARPHDAK